jgi:mono/diheme cytochrome c family protein
MLSDAQIDALVAGIRVWAPQGEAHGPLASVCDGSLSGDARRGARAFADACGSCHGVDGRGSKGVGSIVDESFLALVSDSSLCATFVAGRPDLGCPGSRSMGASKPTAEDVADGVAWVATHRKRNGREPIRSARAEARKP